MDLAMVQARGSIMHPLLHTGHLVEARLRDRLSKVGLRPRQARVLSALERMGECNQKTLAKECDITPASISTMCDRLFAAGWIQRLIDPEEKRAFIIRLTPEGERKVKDVRDAWADIDALIVKAMGKEAATSLASLAGNLRDQLGGHIPGTVKDEE